MRNLFRQKLPLLAAAVTMVFLLPSLAYADSIVDDGNVHQVTIGDAVVLVKIVDGKTYIAVKSGTLNMTNADGSSMGSVAAGASFMLEGFSGLPSIGSNGSLQMGRPIFTGKNSMVRIAVSSNTKQNIRLSVKFTANGKSRTATMTGEPGKKMSMEAKGRYKRYKIGQKIGGIFSNKRVTRSNIYQLALKGFKIKNIRRSTENLPATVDRTFIELSGTGG